MTASNKGSADDPRHEDPAHAPGKRKRGAPPGAKGAKPGAETRSDQHDQPWVPTSGLVGRSRRSPRT